MRHSPIAQQSLKPPAGMSCAVLSLPVASKLCKNLAVLITGSADDAALLAETLRARQAFRAYMMLFAFQEACSAL